MDGNINALRPEAVRKPVDQPPTLVVSPRPKLGSHPNDTLEFIASKISTNIRELEGALIRVTAYASLIDEADATSTLTRNFTHHVFGGSALKMVRSFVDHGSLSPREIQELKELIDGIRKNESLYENLEVRYRYTIEGLDIGNSKPEAVVRLGRDDVRAIWRGDRFFGHTKHNWEWKHFGERSRVPKSSQAPIFSRRDSFFLHVCFSLKRFNKFES